jgi:hypothetical protein
MDSQNMKVLLFMAKLSQVPHLVTVTEKNTKPARAGGYHSF